MADCGTANTREFNAGVSLLKLVACFSVVSLHFGAGGFFRRPAVPTFILIGFYLSARLYAQNNWNMLAKRLLRLAVPFVAWGVISLSCWWVSGHELSLSMVAQQLLCGRTKGVPSGHLYYLEVYAILTLLLFIVPRRHLGGWIYLIVMALMFSAQYSQLNYKAFSSLGYVGMNTFGRICELGPYACVGLLLAGLGSGSWARYWMRSRCLGLMCIFGFIGGCVALQLKLIPEPLGFSYQGMSVFLVAVTLNLMFILLWRPPEMLSPQVIKLLKYASSLTGGIYYMHMLVGTVIVTICGVQSSFGLAVAVFFCSGCLTAILHNVKRLAWLVK